MLSVGDIKPANFCLREEHTNPLCSSEAVLRRSPWLKAIDFGCSQLHFGGCMSTFCVLSLSSKA